MSEETKRERGLVLAPNEYAYVQDTTKGQVSVYVGPTKTSLAGTDDQVVFDEKIKRFVQDESKRAVKAHVTAPENWYVVLKNPAEGNKHPTPGIANTVPELEIGKKIIVRGNCSFALWPGQMAKVIQGHTLRSNEFLKIRFYDAEAAKEGWAQAIGKADANTDDIVPGQVRIVKGTDVSFFIPPTGAEVIPITKGGEDFVRRAVTLQKLEYCVLQSEDGNKEYVKGPNVVFPEPTQRFMEDAQGQCKRKAIELSDIKGIHVKVIEAYTDEDGHERKEGDELFIKGEGVIYYPRKEHAVVKYQGGDGIVHAIAVPEGEGRYILDRSTGQISLKRGPEMMMPDPRNEIIANRVLTDKECQMLYPGNSEALTYNRSLARVVEEVAAPDGLESLGIGDSAEAQYGRIAAVSNSKRLSRGSSVKSGFMGDELDRKNTYTPPRTITLDSKYDGAVMVKLWAGFAMQLVKKSGERRVIVGPCTEMLEYDESPEILALSSGKPKSNDRLKETVFLMIKGNKVSDLVTLTTKDMVTASLRLKYRVDFEGDDPDTWFAISNYVQLLSDHAGSRLKGMARRKNINELRHEITELVRDTILGKNAEGVGREGMFFEENNMRVFDVEVLDLTIDDATVNQMMQTAQRNAITNAIGIETDEAALEATKRREKINQEAARARFVTEKSELELKRELADAKSNLELHTLELSLNTEEQRLANQLKQEESRCAIAEQQASNKQIEHETQLKIDTERQKLEVDRLKALTTAAKDRAQAFTPQLVQAINTASERDFYGKLSENFNDVAWFTKEGVLSTASKFLDMLPDSIMSSKTKELLTGSDDADAKPPVDTTEK